MRAPRRLVLLLAAVVTAPVAPAAAPRHAEHVRLAPQALLVAIAPAGTRLVAVGDRGIIVYSDDRGASWTQADDVPTQALLTGVCFFDAKRGVAVGHDEVILGTADAGRSWQLAHYAPEAQRPLLDVECSTDGHAIAVGAYSAYFASSDAGHSWNESKFAPAPRPAAAAGSGAPAPRGAAAAPESTLGGGYHLNRVVRADGARLYIAAEAGHLYRSDDAGAAWQELRSPYEGSFFGVQPLGGDALLAFGLRGNLYRSDDAGASWRKIDTDTVAMLDGAARFAVGGVAIVGLSGVVLISHDAGRTFALSQQSDRTGLAAALTVADASLAVVGESGARLVAVNAAPAGAGGAQ